MPILVTNSELRMLQVKTRMPFRYGIATMTEFPLVFVRVCLQANGGRHCGIASDLLPPKWFVKQPNQPASEEIDEMLEVIQHALTRVIGLESDTVFGLWRKLYDRQAAFGVERGHPPLLAHFGTSLVERAVMEAFCRAGQMPFAQAISSNAFGIRLGEIHPELGGTEPGDWLPSAPLPRVIARHTVGLGDPLREKDIPAGEVLDDGLPQSLEACIRRYGLKHFKVKVAGDWQQDLPRLRELCALAQECDVREARFSLDGNEQFDSVAAFRAYWEKLCGETWFAWLLERLLFVEQPLRRDAALEEAVAPSLLDWNQRPPILIDESDGDLGALPQALRLGYQGTSHKNCKGVIKGIANRCLIEKRSRHPDAKQAPSGKFMMSGEDLCNQGPTALLQDLAAMACLGIPSVERNGHHYCAGLSAFAPSLQNTMLKHHPDLYHRTARGWPSLKIENGSLSLRSINQSPFGVGWSLPFESFPANL